MGGKQNEWVFLKAKISSSTLIRTQSPGWEKATREFHIESEPSEGVVVISSDTIIEILES